MRSVARGDLPALHRNIDILGHEARGYWLPMGDCEAQRTLGSERLAEGDELESNVLHPFEQLRRRTIHCD